MKKADVLSFSDLARYAAGRAGVSLCRNDPVAYAYWKATQGWAESAVSAGWDEGAGHPRSWWLRTARDFAVEAKLHLSANGDRNLQSAVRDYSRAKWCVILARNRGYRMSPKETGVNLGWLREFDKKMSELMSKPGDPPPRLKWAKMVE